MPESNALVTFDKATIELPIVVLQRSEEWKKEMTLFESGAAVCPNNAKVIM